MYVPLISEYRFDPSEDPKSASFDLMHYGSVLHVVWYSSRPLSSRI